MTQNSRTRWPIWVSIVFTLLIVDVVFRLGDELYMRLYSETSVLSDTVSGWTIANVLLSALSTVAALAIFLRKSIGLRLGIIALVAWIFEGAVGLWLVDSEAESAWVIGFVVGLVASLAVLFGILIERLLRSRAVHEFFGIADPDHPVQLNEPPPPPTFAE